MRIERRISLLAVSMLVGAAPLVHARVLGGGPSKTECYAAFEDIDSNTGKFGVQCRDNDPACDRDTTAGQCTFQFRICAYLTDVPGCTPAPVRKITPKKLKVPALPASSFTCGETNEIVLKLRKNGKPSKRLINVLAQAEAKPSRDPDRLALKCIASPSGAFVLGPED
jgi:hypothetical protein